MRQIRLRDGTVEYSSTENSGVREIRKILLMFLSSLINNEDIDRLPMFLHARSNLCQTIHKYIKKTTLLIKLSPFP
jgi:hypothetical protein